MIDASLNSCPILIFIKRPGSMWTTAMQSPFMLTVSKWGIKAPRSREVMMRPKVFYCFWNKCVLSSALLPFGNSIRTSKRHIVQSTQSTENIILLTSLNFLLLNQPSEALIFKRPLECFKCSHKWNLQLERLC